MHKISVESLHVGTALVIKNTDISVAKSINTLIGINEDYEQPHIISGQVVPPNKLASNLRKNQWVSELLGFRNDG